MQILVPEVDPYITIGIDTRNKIGRAGIGSARSLEECSLSPFVVFSWVYSPWRSPLGRVAPLKSSRLLHFGHALIEQYWHELKTCGQLWAPPIRDADHEPSTLLVGRRAKRSPQPLSTHTVLPTLFLTLSSNDSISNLDRITRSSHHGILQEEVLGVRTPQPLPTFRRNNNSSTRCSDNVR